MKIDKEETMTKKQNFLLPLLFIALIMPYMPLAAQEADEEETASYAQEADEEKTTPYTQEAEVIAPLTQETPQIQETPLTQETPKVQETQQAKPQVKTQTKTQPKVKVKGGAAVLINKLIGYISQIGALFGKTTGIRIGGTTGTGILTLIIARFLENKAPSWVRYALYAGGGTMFAGGGANILKMIMGFLEM